MQLRKGIAGLLACILLLLPLQPVFAQSIEELKKQNEEKSEELDRKRDNIREMEVEEEVVLGELEVLDGKISDLDASIQTIEEEIQNLEESIAKNKEEIHRLENRISENESLFKERVNIMFKTPKGSYAQVLLNSGNFSDMLSRSQMMQSMADYDKSLIEALKHDHDKLETTRKQLDEEMKTLVEKQDQLASEKSEVAAVAEEKNNYVEHIQSQISSESELAAQLMRELDETNARIENLIAEARRAEEERRAEEARIAEEKRLAAEQARREAEEAEEQEKRDRAAAMEEEARQAEEKVSASSGLSYSLVWPVPSSYNITDYYGGRIHPITGVYHHHLGIDIGAGTGSNVVAAQAGTVILASWNGGYGNCVMIDHGNGMTTLYGHLNAMYVSSGQWVEQGQAIGGIGSTGLSTGPHLHFEVSVDGGRQNPLNYLQ